MITGKFRIGLSALAHKLSATDIAALLAIVGFNAWAGLQILSVLGGGSF